MVVLSLLFHHADEQGLEQPVRLLAVVGGNSLEYNVTSSQN